MVAGLVASATAAADAACSEPIATPGDAAYGAYLAGECLTCHRVDGGAEGIPSITGWGADDFVAAVQAYRCGARRHNVMEMLAGRLSDAEIAALATYFEDLE
ncbi:c-type cytochrome [uncultured Roseobacter sp.]|uniref:c-type cytochrome n=1 Tax=uncultured Roseobacter sp. TaxID=114847 RepID=UPI0026309EC0|nr:c-type cytochrome [uncultured Roseobacter sp.]